MVRHPTSSFSKKIPNRIRLTGGDFLTARWNRCCPRRFVVRCPPTSQVPPRLRDTKAVMTLSADSSPGSEIWKEFGYRARSGGGSTVRRCRRLRARRVRDAAPHVAVGFQSNNQRVYRAARAGDWPVLCAMPRVWPRHGECRPPDWPPVAGHDRRDDRPNGRAVFVTDDRYREIAIAAVPQPIPMPGSSIERRTYGQTHTDHQRARPLQRETFRFNSRPAVDADGTRLSLLVIDPVTAEHVIGGDINHSCMSRKRCQDPSHMPDVDSLRPLR